EGGADGHADEALLGDGRIDNALGAELVGEALHDLVGALPLCDLDTDQDYVAVPPHLLGDGVAQRLTHGDGGGRARAKRSPLPVLRRERLWVRGGWLPQHVLLPLTPLV